MRGWSVMGGRASGDRRDGGGATVWLLAAGLLVVLLGGAMATAGAAVVARHRAQAAADLGALAGAPFAIDSEEAACQAAAAIVLANGARLRRCWRQDVDLLVTVEIRPAGPAAVFGSAHASARAGPVVFGSAPGEVVVWLSAWRVAPGGPLMARCPGGASRADRVSPVAGCPWPMSFDGLRGGLSLGWFRGFVLTNWS